MPNLVCPTARVMKTASRVRWSEALILAAETAVAAAAAEVVQAVVVVGVEDGAAQAVGVSHLFNHFGESS